MPASTRTARSAVFAFPEDLCLAYANTLAWRGSAEPVERLGDLDALFEWLEEVPGLPDRTISAHAAWARRDRAAAGDLFADAIALRETIHRIFSAVASEASVRDADLAALNRALAEAPARRRLLKRGAAMGWELDSKVPSVPALLAPVLWSAGDLLLRRDRWPVRRCANAKCLWLFIDGSKSGNRRWCDMASCGNRAKAQRHYLRTKHA